MCIYRCLVVSIIIYYIMYKGLILMIYLKQGIGEGSEPFVGCEVVKLLMSCDGGYFFGGL